MIDELQSNQEFGGGMLNPVLVADDEAQAEYQDEDEIDGSGLMISAREPEPSMEHDINAFQSMWSSSPQSHGIGQ